VGQLSLTHWLFLIPLNPLATLCERVEWLLLPTKTTITISQIINTMDIFTQAKELAKVRGHKILSNHQIATMHRLAQLPNLSVVDIVNELESAPEERLKESVVAARKLLSLSLSKLSTALSPKDAK
jgi:hypothetical protein